MTKPEGDHRGASRGHAFSASAISEINKSLDGRLAAFAACRLEEAFPYLILDARYERVREGGVVRAQAVHIAIGVDWEGRWQILAVELWACERRSSLGDFLRGLIACGLPGVELVVAHGHAGLRAAIRETLPQAAYQRCYVHFLRNALDHLPRRTRPPRFTLVRSSPPGATESGTDRYRGAISDSSISGVGLANPRRSSRLASVTCAWSTRTP